VFLCRNIRAFFVFLTVRIAGVSEPVPKPDILERPHLCINIFPYKRRIAMKAINKVFLLLVMAALVFTACPNPNGGDDDSDIDYTNYSQYSVRASNNTNEELVAFWGSLKAGNLIGGIHAGAQNHGFKNDPAIFTATAAQPIIFITEKQYKDNKNNLNALTNTPFTRVLGFFNKTGTNETIYEISNNLGGEYKIVVQNRTGMDVELRLNGVHGEPIGYAQAGQYNVVLNVDAGTYLLFPVFRKLNQARGEIVTSYPKYPANQRPMSIGATVSVNHPEDEITLDNAYANLENMSTGSAYLLVQNNAQGAIEVRNGSTLIKTATTNETGIPYGGYRIFQINFPLGNGSGEDANNLVSTLDIGAYAIGMADATTKLDTLTNHTVDVDYLYTITVTRETNTGDYVLTEMTKSSTKITLDNIPE
jgi:hypothetical protein